MHRRPDHHARRVQPDGTGSGTTRGDPHYLEASRPAVTTNTHSIREGSVDAESLSEALTVSLTGIIAAARHLVTAKGTPDLSRRRHTANLRQMHGYWPLREDRPAHAKMTLPVHRSILAIDIEDSTQRTNPVKEELRQQVYQLVLDALNKAGIDGQYCDPFTDRGDGVLVLVRPTDAIPKPLLLSRFIPALADLLSRHNDTIPCEERSRFLRLRAVLHSGEVHYDGKGFFGEDLDVAFRLLDAPRFKAFLRHATGSIGLVVSDDIYWSVIRHGYDGINDHEFQPLVTVTIAGRRRKGWVHLPTSADCVSGSHDAANDPSRGSLSL
jgi:class 3 adenylate cyclase